jgi:general stress protein CsbA
MSCKPPPCLLLLLLLLLLFLVIFVALTEMAVAMVVEARGIEQVTQVRWTLNLDVISDAIGFETCAQDFVAVSLLPTDW